MFAFFRRRPRTAAEWVARLNSGQATARDQAELAAWLDRHPEHREQFAAVASVWMRAPVLRNSPLARRYLAEIPSAPVAPGRALAYSARPLLAGAACCALLSAGLLLWMQRDSYRTGVGQSQVVRLEDGSTIWLNTDTRLKVRFEAGRRRVLLSRGEAFFSVARDASRPFVVEAGERRIVVTGTQFDVLHSGEEVAVAVLEGHVRVEHQQAADGAAGAAAVGAEPSRAEVRLVAGQEAEFAPAAAPAVRRNEQVAQKTAWREGRIVLENAALGAALDEVGRYTSTRLVLADPQLRALSITGVFRTGDIDSVLFSLRELYGLRARREGQELILERAG